MNIIAIRDINETDPLPGLGDLVRRAPNPAPSAKPERGIVTGADGRMFTNLPDPTEARCVCGLTPALCATTTCGARGVASAPVPEEPADPPSPAPCPWCAQGITHSCGSAVATGSAGVVGPAFTHEPKPLKVGDRMRVLSPSGAIGTVLSVSEGVARVRWNDEPYFIPTFESLAAEGEEWERIICSDAVTVCTTFCAGSRKGK